jgi:hypothetical protein
MRLPALMLPLILSLPACQRAAAPVAHGRLEQQAYIWQRQWSPAVVDAAVQGGSEFAGYRVLAGESSRNGALQEISPDLVALERTQQPVTAVLRIDGSEPPPSADALADRIAGIVRDWKAAGVRLAGVEIDHDCATAKLPAYARLLASLRTHWPQGLKLSITELPAWLDAPDLPSLLATVDESVLQGHAVQAPANGLFDADAARRWIDRHAQRSPRAFRVALPAYGVKAGFDQQGRALGVEAEAPRPLDGDVRELRVEPEQVAALLRGLEAARPPQLDGVAWFRLPTDQDRRAWSLQTLHAVIHGDSLRPVVKISFDPDPNGARDLLLANVGGIDAPVPQVIVVAALGCDAGDALDGFRLERAGDDWRFLATQPALVRAGRERRIGWLRCDNVMGMKIEEAAEADHGDGAANGAR